MEIIVNLILNALAVFVTAKLLSGVSLDNFGTAVVVAIVLALVNTFVKPILVFLTLPINILTLGLFMFVVNALIILLVDSLVSGFGVASFGWALLFSLVLSFVGSFFHSLTK